jgi:hypothetical protein
MGIFITWNDVHGGWGVPDAIFYQQYPAID